MTNTMSSSQHQQQSREAQYSKGRILRAILHRLNMLSQNIEMMLLDVRLKNAGVHNIKDVKTWTTRRELNVLYNLAVLCPPNTYALEVGSYVGASSCYLAAALANQNSHLICVDTWQNDTIPEGQRDTFAEFEQNVSSVRKYITTLRKRSDQLKREDIPTPLCLVFLDGDHSYEAVRQEVSFFTPLIADKGVLAFHDAVEFEGVARAIGEALASGSWQFGGGIDNLVWLTKTQWAEPEYIKPTMTR